MVSVGVALKNNLGFFRRICYSGIMNKLWKEGIWLEHSDWGVGFVKYSSSSDEEYDGDDAYVTIETKDILINCRDDKVSEWKRTKKRWAL